MYCKHSVSDRFCTREFCTSFNDHMPLQMANWPPTTLKGDYPEGPLIRRPQTTGPSEHMAFRITGMKHTSIYIRASYFVTYKPPYRDWHYILEQEMFVLSSSFELTTQQKQTYWLLIKQWSFAVVTIQIAHNDSELKKQPYRHQHTMEFWISYSNSTLLSKEII